MENPCRLFLTNHLNSSQKHELVTRCLDVLYPTGVNIINLTFDGCASNFSMCKSLGCNLNPDNLNTQFLYKNHPINIIFDPCHIIKLIRNFFGELRQILDDNNNLIDFKYIEYLLKLQEK